MTHTTHIAALLCAVSSVASAQDVSDTLGNPGLTGSYAVGFEIYNDGTGDSFYATGQFAVPGTGTSNIARWDGTQWQGVGGGLAGAYSNVIKVFNGSLVALIQDVLFSGFAGFLSDRYRKTPIIRWCKAGEVLVMFLGLIAFAMYGSLGMTGTWVVLFLMGTQSAFFGPGKYGVLPELFREGLAGASFIATTGYWLLPYPSLYWIVLITLLGFAGMLLDSVLGALFQVTYRDDQTGELMDVCPPEGTKVAGLLWVNNDLVNFIAILLTAALAAYLPLMG